MRPPFRAIAAGLGAGAALAGCANCKEMKDGGSFFAGLICDGEGRPAPEPDPVLPSACQPRVVMPQFFALIDQNDPSLAGLRSVVADLGSPRCAAPAGLVCSADADCAAASCSAANSPLAEVIGVSLRAIATIAGDKPESPALPRPGCLSAAQAKDLPHEQRNRICELRRSLDILLQQLLADPYTKTFFAQIGAGGAQGRDSVIVLVHALTPSITGARSGSEALSAIDSLLDALVYASSSVPPAFTDEVRAVMDSTRAMLGDGPGIFPPLQKVLACDAVWPAW